MESNDRRAFSASVFARCNGRVLLIEHRRLRTWLPVGGEIEPGETPLEAARRELFEETGLTGVFHPVDGAVDGAPLGLIGYEEHQAGSKGLHMNFVFVADVATDQIVANDEIVQHRWVTSTDGIACPTNVRELVLLALHAGPSPLEAMATAWLAAFNGRDLEGLLALYADDAVHTSPKLRDQKPETRGEIRGKEALRAWWRGAMDRLPQLRYEPIHLTASNGRVFMEYERICPPDAPYVVAEVLVCEGGLIRSSHVFHG
ncbi:MAG: SnoaL-like domain-containing protein [Polyangiaceae bacterium]|nr:SnoaL-like domain-containing protein [Polyangiaceae bacterium]